MPRDYRAPHTYRPHSQDDEPAQPAAPAAPGCPGKCNAGYRAAEARYQDGGPDHDIEPRPGNPVWCPACVIEIRTALTDWPDLARRLREEVESGVSAALTEYVSGSKERPVHDHQAASFLLDEFAEWITAWEDTIRRERDLPERRNPSPDPVKTITASAAFLPAHLDWHLGARDTGDEDQRTIVEDFGLDLLAYHRRAQHLTGTQDSEPVRAIGVPCPMCDRKTLEFEIEGNASRNAPLRRYRYGDDGDALTPHRPLGPGHAGKLTETAVTPLEGAVTGYVKCRHCKPVFRMTADEFTRWTKLLAAGAQVRALATPQKLAEVFGSSVPAQYARGAQ